jgi:hypothetical protein
MTNNRPKITPKEIQGDTCRSRKTSCLELSWNPQLNYEGRYKTQIFINCIAKRRPFLFKQEADIQVDTYKIRRNMNNSSMPFCPIYIKLSYNWKVVCVYLSHLRTDFDEICYCWRAQQRRLLGEFSFPLLGSPQKLHVERY